MDKWEVVYSKRMYPAIHKDGKYNGCILNEMDAKFVAKACNEYPELVKENQLLKEKLQNTKKIRD